MFETYPARIGGAKGLVSWQFQQVINALKILFLNTLKLSWTSDFRWSDLYDTAQGLREDHPSIVKQGQI